MGSAKKSNYLLRGIKTRDKLLSRDPDYYKKIGKLGGSVTGKVCGFASMSKEKHKEATARGLATRKLKRELVRNFYIQEKPKDMSIHRFFTLNSDILKTMGITTYVGFWLAVKDIK